MKILLITSRIPFPLRDGGAIATYSHVKGYSEMGHKVTLLSLNTNKHFVDSETIQKELGGYCRVETVDIKTDVKPWEAFKNLFSNKSYNIERFYSDRFARLIEVELKNEKYDVVQFEGLFVSHYLEHTSSSKALKVLRQHNTEHIIWDRLAKNESSFFRKWYLKLLAKRLKKFETEIINKFDTIVAISQSDKDEFRSMGCDKPIFVSPVGVSLDKSSHVWNNKVYHIGSMEWEANKEGVKWFLSSVWPKVIEIIPDARLHLAGKSLSKGDNSYQSESVIVEGEVSDLSNFTNDKSVLIVPLNSGSGIRVKALEGMASGKAVVSTTIGAQGIINTDGGLIVAKNDEEFASQIVRLITDEDYYNSIRQKGFELVELNYTHEAVMAKLVAYYEEA
jgi:glycosyltransferase involved in cell wall biosynthesis